MRILLTGPTGQVGSALVNTLPSLGQVVSLRRSELDLASESSIRAAVRDVRPQVIVNAAAYTAVEDAETDEAGAFRVNRDGPAILAEEAARIQALLFHFSTDYVFDGEKPAPYVESDEPNPLNVYGRSKLAGEHAIRSAGCRSLILRTSWVYGEHGENFVLSIVRAAEEQKKIRVVDDQWGAPTSVGMLATAVSTVIERAACDDLLLGLYHMSAAGRTTWCRFARAILGRDVIAISGDEYQTRARRPKNSVLDNRKLNSTFGIYLPPWEVGLKEMLRR